MCGMSRSARPSSFASVGEEKAQFSIGGNIVYGRCEAFRKANLMINTAEQEGPKSEDKDPAQEIGTDNMISNGMKIQLFGSKISYRQTFFGLGNVLG